MAIDALCGGPLLQAQVPAFRIVRAARRNKKSLFATPTSNLWLCGCVGSLHVRGATHTKCRDGENAIFLIFIISVLE